MVVAVCNCADAVRLEPGPTGSIDLQPPAIGFDVRTKGWETQPLRRFMVLFVVLDCLVAMKCHQNRDIFDFDEA